MPIFLRMKVGGAFCDAAVLQADRPLTIGRSADADVAVVNDSEMSSSHATITLQGGKCHVKDNGSTNGTFLNEKRIQEGEVGAGDDLRCGSTVFRVESPSTAPVSATVSAAPVAARGIQPAAPVASQDKDLPENLQQRQGFVAESAAEILNRFQIEELEHLPAESESTQEYISRVGADTEVDDIVKFLAFALPRRCSIWWAVQCIRSEMSGVEETDPTILDAVVQWLKGPNDELRRQLMALAEAVEMSTAASWAGVAAFWAHGSMGPPDLEEVPAAENMTGKAVAAAVMLATYGETPAKAPARREVFRDLALQIASGERPWENAA